MVVVETLTWTNRIEKQLHSQVHLQQMAVPLIQNRQNHLHCHCGKQSTGAGDGAGGTEADKKQKEEFYFKATY
jgi:hypothetical protein